MNGFKLVGRLIRDVHGLDVVTIEGTQGAKQWPAAAVRAGDIVGVSYGEHGALRLGLARVHDAGRLGSTGPLAIAADWIAITGIAHGDYVFLAIALGERAFARPRKISITSG
ncbi:MAG TPA: hypothetical protein VGF94_08445 [Kofleriaceae bacterium]